MSKVYLGDSVYAEIVDRTADGFFMIRLTTENGLPTDPSNEIFLEPEVYVALKRFIEEAESADNSTAGHPD